MTLADFCRETRNWFDVSRHKGNFTIEDGTVNLDFLSEGQYFRILGSVFNNGIYQYNDQLNLKDESFEGQIWAMAVDQEVLDFIKKVTDWEAENADIINGAYASESFGGYSYTLGTNDGGGISWKTHFANELRGWQKV